MSNNVERCDKLQKITRKFSSIHMIMFAFLFVIMIGSILLSLPISSASEKSVPYVDALFIATSATCVTGLVTLPTITTWSIFGQIVILFLIQMGGLGVITVIAGAMMILQCKININDKILISDSFNMTSIGGILNFVKKVILLTFVIELAGALLYMIVFVPELGLKGIWVSVFTSVSAFCNAGIDIISENSLCEYALNPIINITTVTLIISGGIGFVVLFDLAKVLGGKKRKCVKFLSLHSKIALSVTAFLIIIGTVLILIFEYNNPYTLGGYTFGEKIMVSLFQSVTLRTAGFASIAQECITDASAFISMLLMFIGGSPSGTAGGVKTVTVFVLLVSTAAVIKNKRTVDVFNRQVSTEIIKRSVSIFAVSLLTVIGSTLLLIIFNGGEFIDILYETISAAATVGLSRNYTSTLNTVGKIIITLTMYLGRVGPISLAFAFSVNRGKENLIENPVEEISVG
ncbi:MAG: potassium transporter KtrB [Ruminococcaceae bacterium]|nr:potassium transporter KtrB [Oscillospiraceae bacterium]